jgi:hypothetical protein
MHLHAPFIYHPYWHIIMSSMHLLFRVVTESEEGIVDQVPEETNPSVEVGFDIYGTDPRT